MDINNGLLNSKRANAYYKSLIDNHISKGTCEQRIAILRLRFDNVLCEVLPEIDKDENSFYQAKLEMLFDDCVCSESIKNDTFALKNLLNKFAHSELAAEEKLYLNCLNKLAKFISFCSKTEIPDDLKIVIEPNKQHNGSAFLLSICVDTKEVIFDNDLRTALNDFLKTETEKHPILIKLFPVGNNIGIQKSDIRNYMEGDDMTNAFKNVGSFVTDILNKKRKNNEPLCNPPSLTIVLITSEMIDKKVNIPSEYNKLNKTNQTSTIVIGLDSDIRENRIREVFPDLMVFKKLQNGKYKELFAWLSEILDNICSQIIK